MAGFAKDAGCFHNEQPRSCHISVSTPVHFITPDRPAVL
jgi:hypothetical protein